jgi:hypothetical protein
MKPATPLFRKKPKHKTQPTTYTTKTANKKQPKHQTQTAKQTPRSSCAKQPPTTTTKQKTKQPAIHI